jgi:hypothetical protein
MVCHRQHGEAVDIRQVNQPDALIIVKGHYNNR